MSIMVVSSLPRSVLLARVFNMASGLILRCGSKRASFLTRLLSKSHQVCAVTQSNNQTFDIRNFIACGEVEGIKRKVFESCYIIFFQGKAGFLASKRHQSSHALSYEQVCLLLTTRYFFASLFVVAYYTLLFSRSQFHFNSCNYEV